MNLYLDDDSSQALLVRLLRREGHTVITSMDAGMSGRKDAEHFAAAIQLVHVLLTHNHEDFDALHELIRISGGQHVGVFTVRRDNDKSKDMKPSDIVRAIRNLVAAAVPVADQLIVLNHWR